MSPNRISNPHDSFVRQVLSKIENARDFLENYLPEHVVKHLDLSTVKLEKETFIDQQLREVRSDLLFKLKLKDGAKASIYLLFEHKSYPEPLISLDILRYMVRIWDQWLKQDKSLKHLPSIIPLVLYHGVREWSISRDLSGLITDSEKFEEFIPNFRYSLCDLSNYSDDELKRGGAAMLQGAFMTLKYSRSDRLLEKLPDIFDVFVEIIETPSGLEAIKIVLHYLANGTDKIKEEDLKHALKEAFKDKGGDIMPTLAEKWMQQGMQQGMEQGLQQGMEQGMVQGMIKKSQDDVIEVLITRFGSVPESISTAVKCIIELKRLDDLHKKAITVESLSEFKQMLK